MLSPSAPIFGNLASATSRALAGLQRSVGRSLRSADAVESMRDAGDGGQFSYAARMGSDTRAKNGILHGMQNAVTYAQMQEAGLLHAEQVFERMNTLATQALDPLMNYAQRQALNEEFDSLKQDLESLRTETFQDNYLFDDMAAWTIQKVDFSDGLREETGVTYYETSKDVLYTSGKITLEVNSGEAANRFYIKQGDNVIFDTGNWKTYKNAYQYDFDRFVIEFATGKNTTFEFQPLDTGGSENTKNGKAVATPNGVYDNESLYTSQLNVSSTELEGQTFTSTGQVVTAPATGESTKITIVSEGATLFQATAKYEQIGPTNYVSVGEESLGAAAELDPVGFGTLSGYGIGTVADAASALDMVMSEIEGVGVQLGKLGGNLAELQVASERMSQHVLAGHTGLSRMTDGKLAAESVQLAKEKMRAESRVALAAQARGLRKNLVGMLLG